MCPGLLICPGREIWLLCGLVVGEIVSFKGDENSCAAV